MITRTDGSKVPAKKIIKFVVNPTNVQVTLANGVFPDTRDVVGATISTRAYYHFGAGAPVPIQ